PEPDTVDLASVAGEASRPMSPLPRPVGPASLAFAVLAVAGLFIALLNPSRSTRPDRPALSRSVTAPTTVPETPTRPETSPGNPTDASHLVVALEHPFKRGTLRVWVDDEIRMEERLESRSMRKLLVFRTRKGRETEVLGVSPGAHVVKVRVQGEGFTATRSIRATFKEGETRALEVRVQGMIVKEMALRWAS